MDKKQISTFGSKVSGNTLYVPTYDHTLNIKGFQTIYKDYKDVECKKFPRGLSPSGQFYHFKDFKIAETVYMVEGFGTGASLQMAIDEPVVCGFGTSNIIKAAQTVREINPRATIIFAVDHDPIDPKTNVRAGLHAGQKGLKLLKNVNCKIITPKTEGHDWNDLFLKEGKQAVYEQSRQAKK